MPPLIGRNMATATGSGAWDMAGLLGKLDSQRQENANAQLIADAKRQNVVDEMAKLRLEQERDAKADASWNAFSKELTENPDYDQMARANAAMRHGVTGDDRAKNFLGATLGAGNQGIRKEAETAKGQRFTDQMDFRKSKAQQDYEFADKKWKAAMDAAERARDETERHNKAMEASRWQSIKDAKARTLMSFSSRGGLVIDDEEELLAAEREIDDNKTALEQMQSEQSKAMPDPMLKANYDALLKRTADLEKERQRVMIEGFGPVAPTHSGTVQSERSSSTSRKPVNGAPASQTRKPASTPAPASANAADPLGLFN